MSRQERRKIQRVEYRQDKKARRLAQKERKEQGGFEGSGQTISNAKSPLTFIEQERAEEQRVAIDYLKTMNRLLPGLLGRLAEVEDFRNPKKIKHKVAVILLFAILWFVFQKSSRREANRQMTTPTFLENMRLFFPDLNSLPHHDTVNRFLAGVDIKELD